MNQLIVLFCIGIIIPAFGIKQNADITGRAGYFDNLNNRLPYDPGYQNKLNEVSGLYSEFNKGSSTKKGPRYDVPSNFDEFVPDESDDDQYSYAPGGFYLPSSKKTKMNYFIEEVDDRRNSNLTTKDVPLKETATKGTKVLTGLETETETAIIHKPTLWSYVRKVILNPIFILSIVIVPLTFLAETILPSLLDMLGNNMLPVITSTIASGFARSLDINAVEKVLDFVNEYGARAVEDPRCFQRFLCQASRSSLESRSGDPWSIQKVIRKLSKTVDDRLWDALGLKQLFQSVQSDSCDLLACAGISAYKQDMSLIEKLRLLSAKLFKQTEVVQ
ncbi:uncharacterized protein CDAR_530641 [Caerostris darwini]|uniref:Uncharacterized protein n=1 Tax=Caerostris darwini TaxID=1538125 RepID=A0AAV4N6P5_9ARAC|nr:uncharacterized protein CDAR_530641 [Caerostris darwini]